MKNQTQTQKSRRGFGTTSKEKQSRQTAFGEKASHQQNATHERDRKGTEARRKADQARTKLNFNRSENDGSDHLL